MTRSREQPHRIELADLATSFNSFGFRLYAEMPKAGNVFFSPVSIATSLVALLFGAKGSTADELARLLEIPPSTAALRDAMSEFLSRVTKDVGFFSEFDEGTGKRRRGKKDLFRLHLATSLFAQAGYSLVPGFRDTLAEVLGADIQSLDFGRREAAAAQINAWVAEKTEGRIRFVIGPSDIGPLTRLILANSVYFLAEWDSPFELELTTEKPFYPLAVREGRPSGASHAATKNDRSVPVPMMQHEEHHGYLRDKSRGFDAVEISYRALPFSFVLILPETGRFLAVENMLTNTFLQNIVGSFDVALLRLELPRFNLQWSASVGGVLKRFGANEIFKGGRADFSGITDDPAGLWLSDVFHRAWVNINESGTEAAAVTISFTVGASFIAAPPPKPIPFIVDRPFLFFVRHKKTGMVLFMGRVIDPSHVT
jgi:serpin B